MGASVHMQYSKALLFYREQQIMNQSITWGSKLSEILFVCSSLISRGFLRLMWATSSTPPWPLLEDFILITGNGHTCNHLCSIPMCVQRLTSWCVASSPYVCRAQAWHLQILLNCDTSGEGGENVRFLQWGSQLCYITMPSCYRYR